MAYEGVCQAKLSTVDRETRCVCLGAHPETILGAGGLWQGSWEEQETRVGLRLIQDLKYFSLFSNIMAYRCTLRKK